MKKPTLGRDVFIAPGAILRGDVQIGDRSSIWYNAVVRADDCIVTIGKDSNVQDCSVLHVEKDRPLHIGDGVTIGHNAIVHGCTVGNNTLIGMGAIVMNGAQIGNDCIIGAGALVLEKTVIPDGHMAVGSPAKIKRALSKEEISAIRLNADRYKQEAKEYLELEHSLE